MGCVCPHWWRGHGCSWRYRLFHRRDRPQGLRSIEKVGDEPGYLGGPLPAGGFPGGAGGKEPACQCRLEVRDTGSILGLGRSPGGGHGNPLEYPCLENPMDRGAWRAVHGVSQSWTGVKQISTACTHSAKATHTQSHTYTHITFISFSHPPQAASPSLSPHSPTHTHSHTHTHTNTLPHA